jgi:arylsulfatase A-like enzyme
VAKSATSEPIRWTPRPRRVLTRTLSLLVSIALGTAAASSAFAQLTAPESSENATILIVPGNLVFADTGVDVTAGQALTIHADGAVSIGNSAKGKYDEPSTVGPEGTFLYNDKVAKLDFPLAAAASGPAPCFCLMGRIGNGEPFFVGRSRSWKPSDSGRLYLGVNDFDASDNDGQFVVSIAHSESVQPIRNEQVVPIDSTPGHAVPGCSVVVFYLDGLRPDVIREMAAMGHIPNINRLFVEGGVWMQNAFTGFPSDTITSNGTMWTGCSSDRHGLKGQVSFSRRTLESKSYLDPMGPSRSARQLAPQGLDRFVQETGAASVQVIDGDEASQRYRAQQASGIPPLYAHLRHNGEDWSTGALPIMTEFPPVPWSRSLTKYVPYFQYHDSWRYMDEANTDYAKNFLFERKSPVTIVWLPETDSVSHHDYSRGQFGTTRRIIARADLLIGQMVDEIEARHRLDRTYFILCSDHGHHGGQKENLSHYDLADEFFYKPRLLTPDGAWVGGGLGLSVRQHRFWNRHPEDRPIDFVFIDADQDGTARVFLPNREYKSGTWYGKPRPGDLLGYRLAENVAPVNLISSLTQIEAARPDGTMQRPVDLVIVKLTDDSILVSTQDRGNAVVSRHRDAKGKWVYKYRVVDHLQPTADGGIAFHEVTTPETDPLGLVEHLHPRLLTYEHDENEWLRLTALSKYPDAVVAITRHMLWQENLSELELEHAPDLVVTARSGWYFGIGAALGTTHGYPLADSMRPTFFVSGPGVLKSARVEEPCRLTDLTPTILDMIGYGVETGDFDGHALRNIYQTVPAAPPAAQQVVHTDVEPPETRPLYWDDVDLKAWKPLQPALRPEYEHKPLTIHHPYSPYDLHNVAYNLLSISDFNVLRFFDNALSPFDNGRPIATQAFEFVGDQFRHSKIPAVSDAADALDVSTTTIGDYSFTSAGNMKRIDGVIDWLQHRVNEVDGVLARPFGAQQSPGVATANKTVDGFQWWFWDTYEFGQRVVGEYLDEGILNGMENAADRNLNQSHLLPAQMIVEPPQK